MSNDKINALTRSNKELNAELKTAHNKIDQLQEESIMLNEKIRILQIRLRNAESVTSTKDNSDIIIEYYTQNGKTDN